MFDLPYAVPKEQLERPDIPLGKIAQDAWRSGDGYQVPIFDIAQPILERMQKDLDEFIRKVSEDYLHFFVVIQFIKPPDAPNAIRTKFFSRHTPCIPEPGLSLLEVDVVGGRIKWHWSLPDRDSIYGIYMNKHLMPQEEKHLLKHIIEYVEGRMTFEPLVVAPEYTTI